MTEGREVHREKGREQEKQSARKGEYRDSGRVTKRERFVY